VSDFLGWAVGSHGDDFLAHPFSESANGKESAPLETQIEALQPMSVESDDEPDADALHPVSTYEQVLKYRRKRFNLVKVLQGLEYPRGGKAHMDIPLCRMRSLQVMRLALQNDILKLQAHFVHGYRVGTVVFYVSLTDERGRGMEVRAKDRENWDKHWQQRDREFETFFNANSDLKFLSNRYLYVWDGNHRLLAWNDHIDKVHRGDLAWHY
jgi:hypothetical protein